MLTFDKKISYLSVQYTCPECDKRVEREIPFILKDKGNISMASAGWCPHIYCEARHKFEYKVVTSKKEQPQIQGLLFSSNEKKVNKRLKVLAWC